MSRPYSTKDIAPKEKDCEKIAKRIEEEEGKNVKFTIRKLIEMK